MLTLTGNNNTYTGGTFICDCATLQLGDGGTSGSITGTVTNSGLLIFNRSDVYTFNDVIEEGGRRRPHLQRDRRFGATVFTADNTYSGGTLINAGAVQVQTSGRCSALAT